MAAATMAPKMADEASSDESTSTPLASDGDLQALDADKPQPPKRRKMTLAERRKIPASLYVSLAIILGGQYSSGMWTVETPKIWLSSCVTSAKKCWELLVFLRDFMQAAAAGEITDKTELAKVAIVTLLVASILYVLIGAPLRAGFWTGRRSSRHLMHRYMGLAYLIQYGFAWVEYLTNYEDGFRLSFLTHTLALNGMIQGYSAFFSFSVLPDLEDPGYYSDKAVVSRNFVHENIFFTLMAVWGSFYYNEPIRENLQNSILGRIIEAIFIFWPYIVIRPIFPITRFKNTGTTRNGRTDKNEYFYQVGTLMVKFFYLWAKYFLGFFMNYLVYLNLFTKEQWRFQHGMYLLNLGTVSISIFLHTLRFKKVLPAKLTFSLYLMQIYATFSAIPMAYDCFSSHRKLCGMCALGVAANMTRNRKIHAVWCCVMMYFLAYRKDIDW